MKNVKRHISIICFLAFVLVLAACGPKESSESGANEKETTGTKELIVWEDIEKAEGIKDAVAKFEKEHDVTVKVVEKAYAQQIEDLRLDGPAGTGPDVLTMAGDQIGTAVTEGLIKELKVDEGVQAIYTESALQSQMVEGKIYGLPKAVETTLLYYNKDIISEDELPKTLDEWYEKSKELTKDGNYGFLALFDQIYYAQSVLGGYGGYIFGNDGNGNYDSTDVGLNNEGAIEGAEYIQKFYKEIGRAHV